MDIKNECGTNCCLQQLFPQLYEFYYDASLFCVADTDPGIGSFLTPGSGMEKIRIRDPGLNIPQSLVTSFGLKILKFLINLVLRIRIRDQV